MNGGEDIRYASSYYGVLQGFFNTFSNGFQTVFK